MLPLLPQESIHLHQPHDGYSILYITGLSCTLPDSKVLLLLKTATDHTKAQDNPPYLSQLDFTIRTMAPNVHLGFVRSNSGTLLPQDIKCSYKDRIVRLDVLVDASIAIHENGTDTEVIPQACEFRRPGGRYSSEAVAWPPETAVTVDDFGNLDEGKLDMDGQVVYSNFRDAYPQVIPVSDDFYWKDYPGGKLGSPRKYLVNFDKDVFLLKMFDAQSPAPGVSWADTHDHIVRQRCEYALLPDYDVHNADATRLALSKIKKVAVFEDQIKFKRPTRPSKPDMLQRLLPLMTSLNTIFVCNNNFASYASQSNIRDRMLPRTFFQSVLDGDYIEEHESAAQLINHFVALRRRFVPITIAGLELQEVQEACQEVRKHFAPHESPEIFSAALMEEASSPHLVRERFNASVPGPSTEGRLKVAVADDAAKGRVPQICYLEEM